MNAEELYSRVYELSMDAHTRQQVLRVFTPSLTPSG